MTLHQAVACRDFEEEGFHSWMTLCSCGEILEWRDMKVHIKVENEKLSAATPSSKEEE